MKAEHVNPFVEAAAKVLASIGLEPERGSLYARTELLTEQQINVWNEISGEVNGVILYSMSMTTADRIASQVLGEQVVTFDAVAADALADLANAMTGQSVLLLRDEGIACDTSPASIIRGANVKVPVATHPALVVPFSLGEFGVFEVAISLTPANQKAA